MGADQVKLGELRSHLSEDRKESVCIKISTPQVELLQIEKGFQKVSFISCLQESES